MLKSVEVPEHGIVTTAVRQVDISVFTCVSDFHRFGQFQAYHCARSFGNTYAEKQTPFCPILEKDNE